MPIPHIGPKLMSHVAYRTYQYDKMICWYREVFGARITSRNDVLAFLTFDDESHRFAIANLGAFKPESEAPPVTSLVGVDHISYTFANVADLFSTYERLRQLNVTPYWCIHHGNTVSMYYADPDDNQMEFQIETSDAQDQAGLSPEAKAKINGSIGVEFDPDDWLDRLKTGIPEVELLVRTVHEPVSPLRGALQRGYRHVGNTEVEVAPMSRTLSN